MILLDTNIISELMRPKPEEKVLTWLNEQESRDLFVSTISIAEISYGLHVLPEGHRRNVLKNAFGRAVQLGFLHRILSFDEAAAREYGKIMAIRKAMGRPLGVPDGQIAAIAYSQKMRLATRNVKDFVDCGLQLVNPF